MRDNKRRLANTNIITTVICAVVIFASLFWSYQLLKKTDLRLYDNRIRLVLLEDLKQIENGDYSVCKYPYVVFGTDGKVKYADSEFNLYLGTVVNIQDMIQTDESFSKRYDGLHKEVFILKDKDIVTDFVIFLVPEELLMKDSTFHQLFVTLTPIGLGFLILLLVHFIRTFYINYFILKPIREISKSASLIIKGNYNYEVLRVNGTKVNKDEMGDLVYSFELMRDELKNKQMREEQLKKSQQELISCISHDLKTPVSTIKAYSEGLRDNIATSEEVRREYIDIIIKKTNLLSEMMKELLEYSNAQLNQLEIVPKEVYFRQYFEAVGKELQVYARQRDTSLTYHMDDFDILVNIDCKRITEVLYNLIENSIKYTSEVDGQIDVHASKHSEGILIQVIDNGAGISADDIPYVFDKFYRAEKSRTSSIPGSGLGLSICKYIIEAQGGTIYCKSGSGKGCEIGFILKAVR